MAWDSTRKVPWRRLMREWVIYAGIAIAAYVVYYEFVAHKKIQLGLFAGLLSSGPMYLLFGGVLAKFGYQRKTMKELRAEREERGPITPRSSRSSSSSGTATAVRARPAPTKRTSTGPSQYRPSNKPKRR